MKYIRSLRLAGLSAVAAVALGLAVPFAHAQDRFSFGFSDRGGGFSLGVNDGRYRGYRDRDYYGPRYYYPPYYSGRDPYWRDRWEGRRHRVQVYDPVYDRYVWVWR